MTLLLLVNDEIVSALPMFQLHVPGMVTPETLSSRVSFEGALPVTPPGAGPPRGAPSARGWVFESKFSIVQKIILNLKFKNSHYFHIFNGSDQD